MRGRIVGAGLPGRAALAWLARLGCPFLAVAVLDMACVWCCPTTRCRRTDTIHITSYTTSPPLFRSPCKRIVVKPRALLASHSCPPTAIPGLSKRHRDQRRALRRNVSYRLSCWNISDFSTSEAESQRAGWKRQQREGRLANLSCKTVDNGASAYCEMT
jgi:hypothetical protein